MINQMPQYAASEQRFWDKWKKSGAVETINDAVDRTSEINNITEKIKQGLIIDAMGKHFQGKMAGYTTLSLLPPNVQNKYTYLVVEGHNYKLGDKLTSVPPRSLTLNEAFGHQ